MPATQPPRQPFHVVDVRELTKRYGDKTDVDALTISVKPGIVAGADVPTLRHQVIVHSGSLMVSRGLPAAPHPALLEGATP